MAVSGTLIPRVYGSFRGVDFRGEEIDLMRSPDSLNVWKDYRETESIRTRPSMELDSSYSGRVWGVFFYKVGNVEMKLVHVDTSLYRVVGEARELIKSGLNPRRSQAFVYNNIWYFKDGIHYLEYDGETIKDVEGYIPTTSIGRKPKGGGTVYEDVNMLSEYRRNSFVGDGATNVYYLDTADLNDVVSVTVDGMPLEEGKFSFVVDSKTGANGVWFSDPPPAPLTDGQDNVVVTFRKEVQGHRDRINHCTLLQVFDNRVFFSGNPDFPNVVWHCSLNDPTYCADLDYYNEGLDMSPVRAMVAGNNALWVFKEPSQADTTVFYHNPVVDADYGKIYPSVHSSIATGCVATGINFSDDIAFFSDRGMEAINGDITTEQVIAHRSSLVDRKLLSETNYKDMILEEWEGYLLVITDNKVYLADSRAVTEYENHVEYEWFYWELEKAVTCARVHNGVLYLGTDDGIYTMTGNDHVVSCWTTPLDKFKYPHYLKTTNKRGCTVEATGDIDVYVKTNKTEWELVGKYENVEDYFVCRIKRKKFKDIQLKFHSNTRFSLETATLECYIGGYIKR